MLLFLGVASLWSAPDFATVGGVPHEARLFSARSHRLESLPRFWFGLSSSSSLSLPPPAGFPPSSFGRPAWLAHCRCSASSLVHHSAMTQFLQLLSPVLTFFHRSGVGQWETQGSPLRVSWPAAQSFLLRFYRLCSDFLSRKNHASIPFVRRLGSSSQPQIQSLPPLCFSCVWRKLSVRRLCWLIPSLWSPWFCFSLTWSRAQEVFDEMHVRRWKALMI
jgi:hypothetical protein